MPRVFLRLLHCDLREGKKHFSISFEITYSMVSLARRYQRRLRIPLAASQRRPMATAAPELTKTPPRLTVELISDTM